jgi:hypothetical protein
MKASEVIQSQDLNIQGRYLFSSAPERRAGSNARGAYDRVTITHSIACGGAAGRRVVEVREGLDAKGAAPDASFKSAFKLPAEGSPCVVFVEPRAFRDEVSLDLRAIYSLEG